MKSNNTHKVRCSLLILFLPLLICSTACRKYLDEKPDKKLAVPETLLDAQALLDAYSVINFTPALGEISADDYYLTDVDWAAMFDESERKIYHWEQDFVYTQSPNDWFYSYRTVYSANTVLEILHKINRNDINRVEFDNIKGQALFARAISFFQAAIVWAPAYDKNTAQTDLGIPLRLNTDFNQKSVRSSNKDTYNQIIKDLKDASELLQVSPLHVLRSSRPAAYALLARVYLSMGQYDSCGKYADLCLKIKSNLMDYNGSEGVDPAAEYPFSKFNPEVIYSSSIGYPESLYYGYIDSVLYVSYSANDKRKTVFFSGPQYQLFKGNYHGADNLFAGIATDEVYLMRAESFARMGNITNAMNDLNALLIKRWATGTFVPLSSPNTADALSLILNERRKELLMRGLRWLDLKRLNKGGRNITITRVLKGQLYTLEPNSLRYALPIPADIINISGMQQNPR